MFAFLREQQRRHAIAVAVVHGARKGAGAIRAGQVLRGSSEFHAWDDSNLYLRRDSDDRIVLTVEHRATAAAAPGVTLELTQRDDALVLHPVHADPQPERRVEPISVDQRIIKALAGGKPQPFPELRASCRVRTITLYERLVAMTAAGLIVKSADGYCLAVR